MAVPERYPLQSGRTESDATGIIRESRFRYVRVEGEVSACAWISNGNANGKLINDIGAGKVQLDWNDVVSPDANDLRRVGAISTENAERDALRSQRQRELRRSAQPSEALAMKDLDRIGAVCPKGLGNR